MEERFIAVRRTARYHLLGRAEAAAEVWVALHGYGQLARYFLKRFQGLEEGRCIAAPEALSRFYLDERHTRVGATWMTREDRLHEIGDQAAYLDALAAELRRQAMPGAPLHVLGFSQGVAAAARWAIRASAPIGRLVLWAGTLPPELDATVLQRWRGLPVDLVLGDADQYMAAADLEAQAHRLERAGVTVRRHRFEGGHELDPLTPARVLAAR